VVAVFPIFAGQALVGIVRRIAWGVFVVIVRAPLDSVAFQQRHQALPLDGFRNVNIGGIQEIPQNVRSMPHVLLLRQTATASP